MNTQADIIKEEVAKLSLDTINGIHDMLKDGHFYSEITIAFNLVREDMIPEIRLQYGIDKDIPYWTDERIEELRQYHASGMPMAAMVEHFPNCTLSKVRIGCTKGELVRYRQSTWSAEMIEGLRFMLKEGNTGPEIAKELNLTLDQVRYKMRKLGITKTSMMLEAQGDNS